MTVDTQMRAAVRWWLAGGLVSLTIWALAIVGVWTLLSCATGHVRPDGEMVCAAIGESAHVRYSTPEGEAGVLTAAPTRVVECQGGPLVPSLLDGVGTVVKALFSWIVL